MVQCPFVVNRIEYMTEEEMMDLFDWYEFRDPAGHGLTKCTDFVLLVKRAAKCAMGELASQGDKTNV